MYAVTIGATVGVITVIFDGGAAEQLADQWAAVPASAKAAALGLVSLNETIAGVVALQRRAERQASASVGRAVLGRRPPRGGAQAGQLLASQMSTPTS